MGLTDMPAPEERGPVEGGQFWGLKYLVSARCPAAEPAAPSVEASSASPP